MENKAFFSNDPSEICLTSTSANYIANVAKEYIQTLETNLKNIKLYNTEISLLGSKEKQLLSHSIKNVNEILSSIHKIIDIKSLIAWLREAIKYKESLLEDISKIKIETWADKFNIEIPYNKTFDNYLTEEKYYDSLDVKERNRYYSLETKAAILGKFIHPDGELSNARKKLQNIKNNPNELIGDGRDAILYSYTYSTDLEKEVENLFFALQKEYREAQAELNSIKQKCKDAVYESTCSVNNLNENYLKEFHKEMDLLYVKYNSWVEQEKDKISKLKIRIPKSLIPTYELIKGILKS